MSYDKFIIKHTVTTCGSVISTWLVDVGLLCYSGYVVNVLPRTWTKNVSSLYPLKNEIPSWGLPSVSSSTPPPRRGALRVQAIPMAARLGALALALAAALLLLASSAAAAAATGDEGGGSTKVGVALYYESLCPYSARFVVNYLAKVFEDGLLSAIDLMLVPYGNARVATDGKISCQHGPYECLLNTVEACAIDAWPELNKHFGFIYCVEDLVVKHQYREWKSCFQKLGLDPKPVTECYKSEHGHNLELKYANQTDALEPPHRYVPWVVVDGKPLLEDYENLEAYICKAYKGSPPKVCEGLGVAPRTQEQDAVEARNGVSYNYGDIKLQTAQVEGGESKMVLLDDDN
ncbi:gamma-interferon-responsive lysosomal thiol protein-like [Phragmites australis]|uniref:gamma-interferon-responsive lysosomal thiol protein-like n=1 Tax=Phragmites australis TaxID=29695 RepID=UPI002D790663|nr:gamma-interferon-responsive lysosomal thiol protein-like [Phragmites australis]